MSENSSPISVLVADSNAMLCGLLKTAFDRKRLFRVAGAATSVNEIKQRAADTRIDIAVIGAHLHEGAESGITAVRDLRGLQPLTRSILLIDPAEEDLVIEAFRAGAKGVFVRVGDCFEMLCKCVARVHGGEIWASSRQLELVMETLMQSAPVRVLDFKGANMLSKREGEVVRLVADGLTNREIAAELGVSEHTVKNHLFRIFDKLGVSTRVEVVLYAKSGADAQQRASQQRAAS